MGRTKRSRIYTSLMRTLTFKVGENVTFLSDHWGSELMGTLLRRRGLSQMAPTPNPSGANACTQDLRLDGEAGVSFVHPALPWPRGGTRALSYTPMMWSMRGRWDTTRVVAKALRLRGKGWFSLLAKKNLES